MAKNGTDFDRVDSGMSQTGYGTPYTLSEAERVVEKALEDPDYKMDPHHVELMQFLIRRVKRLEREVARERD